MTNATLPRREAWMILPFVAYAAYSAARAELRVEHVVLVAAVSARIAIARRHEAATA